MASERSQRSGSIDLLASALDQTAMVMANVRTEQLDARTPCTDWTVGGLIDHIVAALDHFAEMMRGEQPDFSTAAPHVGTDRLERFDSDAQGSVDWQLAELAVHTWDLATSTGQPTDRLNPDVARLGLDFMRANLRDNRGTAFRPAQPPPDNADPYEQIAAFAGRTS